MPARFALFDFGASCLAGNHSITVIIFTQRSGARLSPLPLEHKVEGRRNDEKRRGAFFLLYP